MVFMWIGSESNGLCARSFRVRQLRFSCPLRQCHRGPSDVSGPSSPSSPRLPNVSLPCHSLLFLLVKSLLHPINAL